MIQTIKQNKKAVLAFLLALVMVIGLIPFTTTEVQALEIEAMAEGVKEAFTDDFTLVLWSPIDSAKHETHQVTYTEGTGWNTAKSNILPANAFAYKGSSVTDISYTDNWKYTVTLQTDQSDAEKLADADVMIATGSANAESALYLNFEHVFAKVTFNISFNSEFVTGTDKVTALTVSSDNAVKAFVGETTAEAIIAPRTYTAGDLFATVTVNGYKLLEVKVPENGLTFEAGKHYTFNLTVGKDMVTLTPVGTSADFPGGWNTEENLGGETDTIGTPDAGKTAWAEGDQTIVTLFSQKYGEQAAALTYNGSSWSTETSLSYLEEEETPYVRVFYAPCYEVTEEVVMQLRSGMQLGMTEFLYGYCVAIEDGIMTCTFEDVRRDYSRLRIVAMPYQTLTVTTTDFNPAGTYSWAYKQYTLTADENGNAFLYGTFDKGATVTVKDGDTELATHTFDVATEAEKSYALYAGKKVDVDLSTLAATYVINDDAYYTFTGTGNYGIKVESGNPTIILNNASITVGEGSAIDIASGSNATIQVLGDNTIDMTEMYSANAPRSGIFVAEGGTVNITSNGTDNILRARGNDAAAIGGKYVFAGESYNAGSINISNVTVYAYTNYWYAAAIGAAGEGTCGTINITNAVVYAYGGGDDWTSAPGIGSAMSDFDWPETTPVVIISDSEIHTFRFNQYSDYIGYVGDEYGEEYGYHATGGINCGEGGSVKSSTIYCYTGENATTTDKVVSYDADGTATEN